MKQWEYKVRWDPYVIPDLTELGGNGWELVSVLIVDNKLRYYFKRELQPDNAEQK